MNEIEASSKGLVRDCDCCAAVPYKSFKIQLDLPDGTLPQVEIVDISFDHFLKSPLAPIAADLLRNVVLEWTKKQPVAIVTES